MVVVNGNKIEYTSGMTIADALASAAEAADTVTLVVLDGMIVPPALLNSTQLSDGSVIKLMRVISGG